MVASTSADSSEAAIGFVESIVYWM